jgi:Major Facilitator Superfamily
MSENTNSPPSSTLAGQLHAGKPLNDTSSADTGPPENRFLEDGSLEDGSLGDGSTPGGNQLSTVNEKAKPRREVTGFRWFLVCVAIFSANALYGLDTTIAADIQAFVSETFDNVTQLGWLGVGFTLGSTVAILPLGKAFGIFDTKWIFISCLTMFAAASALCAAAPSMNAIIIGRVWAGAGGAGMYLG